MTFPPRPPFPPSGPPRGTNFSRRKLRAPAPPSPPLTKILTRSVNIRSTPSASLPAASSEPGQPGRPGLPVLDRLDGLREDGAFLAPVTGPLEADHAVDKREQRVIPPHADVGSGEDRGASLTKKDGAGADRPARAGLHSQPLGDAVASVA